MKKLIFFLLSTIIISCTSASLKVDFCLSQIQFHLSSNCEDSPENAVMGQLSTVSISNIEDILSEAEIGECVLVNLDGSFSYGGESLQNVYIVNDTDKLWLVVDCRN